MLSNRLRYQLSTPPPSYQYLYTFDTGLEGWYGHNTTWYNNIGESGGGVYLSGYAEFDMGYYDEGYISKTVDIKNSITFRYKSMTSYGLYPNVDLLIDNVSIGALTSSLTWQTYSHTISGVHDVKILTSPTWDYEWYTIIIDTVDLDN